MMHGRVDPMAWTDTIDLMEIFALLIGILLGGIVGVMFTLKNLAKVNAVKEAGESVAKTVKDTARKVRD